MNDALSPVLKECALVYLDDTVVFSKTFADHMHHVHKVLDLFLAKNLKAFLSSQAKMLGKIITGSGIAPDPDLIHDMVDFPVPHNSKQVMWFLGLCGVYQNFIRDFQLIAKPLHDLTHKKVTWRWGEIENKAFVALKN